MPQTRNKQLSRSARRWRQASHPAFLPVQRTFIAALALACLADFSIIPIESNAARFSLRDDSEDSDRPNYFEDNLAELPDRMIEDELRRRTIGGPWAPESAASILREAMDQLFRRDNRTVRSRPFQSQAEALLALLTGQEDSRLVVEEEADTLDAYEEPLDDTEQPWMPSRETMQKIVDMVDGTGGQRRRSVSAISGLYKDFQPFMLPRFRERLSNPTRLEKFRSLHQRVLKVFAQARDKRQPVHGRMIRQWARQESLTLNLTDFKASESWLTRFKRRNGIVSRKVTDYTFRTMLENAGRVADSIEQFWSDYNEQCVEFPKSAIWNFDQTGFNYEPSNLRTLSFRGERDTSLFVNNRNKNTHSYTVQPLISRSGELFGKFLIVMQETGGKFGPIIGPRVAELERLYGNIEVYASTSGKLSSELINRWYNGTFRRAVQRVTQERMIDDEPSVLVLADSWSGQAKTSQRDFLRSMGAQMLVFPPSTTDRIQPLDVNFNRQFKIFYNRIMEEAHYRDMLPNVTSRDALLNIHSLIHNQFTSPKYKNMLLYAWKDTDPSFNATAEMSQTPPKMVNNIQFTFNDSMPCQHTGCSLPSFITCSHCGKVLCLHHFLNRTCVHSRNQPTRTKRTVNPFNLSAVMLAATVKLLSSDSVQESEKTPGNMTTTTLTIEAPSVTTTATTATTYAPDHNFGSHKNEWAAAQAPEVEVMQSDHPTLKENSTAVGAIDNVGAVAHKLLDASKTAIELRDLLIGATGPSQQSSGGENIQSSQNAHAPTASSTMSPRTMSSTTAPRPQQESSPTPARKQASRAIPRRRSKSGRRGRLLVTTEDHDSEEGIGADT